MSSSVPKPNSWRGRGWLYSQEPQQIQTVAPKKQEEG